ncbi:MAG: CarD family transcriptional regulator [Oscillospiraceae bacterium]|jgi:CarD family transcriptional regulator|nr:CarD family transcriptional regulator [Oscillospiraceae bacterium]
MYQVGDKIVHPMHGAGVIENIVSQKAGGALMQYYVMKMPVVGMLVMIPTHNAQSIGVREVVDSTTAEDLICSLAALETDTVTNWNKRYRENMLRIKSGELFEVARVVKSLTARDKQRGLSTGERKMLHSAKQILISEIVLAQSAEYADVERRINKELA